MFASIMRPCLRRGQQAERKAEQQGGKAAAHQDTFRKPMSSKTSSFFVRTTSYSAV